MPKRPVVSLHRALPRWIARETSEAVARRFAPWILKTLSGLGYNPAAPISDREFARVRTELRRADLTPALMELALQEARRAGRENLSTLQWARAVQKRAYGEDLAQKTLRVAKQRLKSQFSTDETALQSPPTPEETLAFLLAWEELGGTSLLAAFREMRRQVEGALPQN